LHVVRVLLGEGDDAVLVLHGDGATVAGEDDERQLLLVQIGEAVLLVVRARQIFPFRRGISDAEDFIELPAASDGGEQQQTEQYGHRLAHVGNPPSVFPEWAAAFLGWYGAVQYSVCAAGSCTGASVRNRILVERRLYEKHPVECIG